MPKTVTEIYDIPDKLDIDFLNNLMADNMFGIEGIWQLSYRDLRKKNVRINGEGELSQFAFNEKTSFPDELSDVAKRVLEEGKAGRLSNHSEMTGKGIKIAIIDKPLNPDHKEFESRIEVIEVEPGNINNASLDFHGMTCASLLAGKTCGVAPEAALIYFQIPDSGDRAEISGYALRALKMIIDYNKTNETDPIRLVSWSGGFVKEDLEKRNRYAQILAQKGCYVIDATMFMRNFGGIDFNPYAQEGERRYSFNEWQLENYERNKERLGFTEWFDNCCYVPSSRCTSASDDIADGYIHWSKAVSESWTIPQAVGAMALCMQKKPDLSYEVFTALAKKCPKEDGYIILNVDCIMSKL